VKSTHLGWCIERRREKTTMKTTSKTMKTRREKTTMKTTSKTMKTRREKNNYGKNLKNYENQVSCEINRVVVQKRDGKNQSSSDS
jgi:hypothetical protein